MTLCLRAGNPSDHLCRGLTQHQQVLSRCNDSTTIYLSALGATHCLNATLFGNCPYIHTCIYARPKNPDGLGLQVAFAAHLYWLSKAQKEGEEFADDMEYRTFNGDILALKILRDGFLTAAMPVELATHTVLTLLSECLCFAHPESLPKCCNIWSGSADVRPHPYLAGTGVEQYCITTPSFCNESPLCRRHDESMLSMSL